MEEGTPVLEAFTESVGDGPSQPLMRKLMSMIWTPEAPRQGPDISGFFLVEPPPSLSVAGSSSRQVPLEITEDIAQTVGCPVEDMETVVQSGFRFAGAEGCCDSPRAENYFTESSIPADLADKVPIDFLHAINNVLDTKVYPTPRSHHHGRRRNARRTRAPQAFMRNREQEFFGPQAEFASSETNYGQEMILRRLDRLEEICLRTESYVHVVLGTMDKRLQLLEADGLRSTQDSACSPTFPGPGGLFSSEADTFEAGTFVTPEMLMVQSPRPATAGVAVLQVPDADEAQVAAMCLSPIDALPSPALILTGSPSEAFRTSDVSQSAYPFSSAAAAAQEVFSARAGLDEFSAAMAPPTRDEETESADRPQISAVAVFSLAPDAVAGASYENPVDALLCDPVVTWENDGFPYLRPAYQMPTAPSPPLRDTTVLTWEAARYLFPDSSGSEDDRPTPHSSDDAFSFYNMEEPAREEPSASQHPRYEACRRKEDSMLDEISSILKNICNNLEVLRTPEQSAGNAASTSGSCPRCCGDRGSERPATLIQEMMACKDQEEIISVLEGMFTRLAFLPQPEDVLVNMLPTMEADSSTGSASPPAVPDSPPREVVIEGVKPQNAEADQTPEIHPQDAGTGPKVSLSFIQEDFSKAAEASSLSQDMHVEIDAASTEPVTFHIAIAPKEMTVTRDAEESNTEDIASSIVEDICVSMEGPYQEMVVNEYTREELPPEDREAVTVSKDKVQLAGDLVADYTLKVVPRSQHEGQDAAGSSAETNVEEKTLVDNEAVSSVIHELCFSMEAPRTDAAGGEAPELPLQIGIAVTADPKTDTGLVIRDSPGSTSSDQEEHKEIAAIVLNLEGLQKTEERETAAGVSCCSKPGCTRAVLTSSSLENYVVAEPDEDDQEENRPLSFNWEGVPCSGECEDIPCLIEEADRKVLGKDEVTSVHQEVCISVEVPNAALDNDERGSCGVHIGVSVRAVPEHSSSNELISCVEIPPEQEFEKIPFTEVTYVVEQPKEDELQPLNKPSLEQTTDEIKNLSEDESVESIVGPPPSPMEASPETHDYLFKEEKKPGPENEWMIESIFLPKESFQQVQAKVPKLVLKGMTPMDLIRGSLHFDGKACLLSVSIDEIWTAEDMCPAPVSTAAVFAKHKLLLDPPIPSPVRKNAAEDVSFRDMPAWLGDVLADGFKPVGGDKVQAFGFRCASRKQQQAETFKGAMTLGFGLQQQSGAVLPVFGFRSVPGKAVQQQIEPSFGFRSLVNKPPLAPAVRKKPSVNIPVAEEDCDSSLSVVSRSPASRSRSKLPEDEQPPKPRVPDSPGARSCMIDGKPSSSSGGGDLEKQVQEQVAVASNAAETGGSSEAEELEEAPKSRYVGSSTAPGTGLVPPKTALDLLDAAAGSGSEEEFAEAQAWTAGLHVLPVELAGGGGSASQDDTFFDALQCSAARHGSSSNNNKNLKKYLKDKLWNRFSCYGGIPESDSSDAPCIHDAN